MSAVCHTHICVGPNTASTSYHHLCGYSIHFCMYVYIYHITICTNILYMHIYIYYVYAYTYICIWYICTYIIYIYVYSQCKDCSGRENEREWSSLSDDFIPTNHVTLKLRPVSPSISTRTTCLLILNSDHDTILVKSQFSELVILAHIWGGYRRISRLL